MCVASLIVCISLVRIQWRVGIANVCAHRLLASSNLDVVAHHFDLSHTLAQSGDLIVQRLAAHRRHSDEAAEMNSI